MQIKCVTEWLDKSEEMYPEKIAYQDDESSVTYSELKRLSMCIAGRFSDFNIFKRPIIVYMGRRVECLVSFWGCAYSGNFYSPVDVNTPIKRAQRIAECLKPDFIITDNEHTKDAKLICSNAEVIVFDDLIGRSYDTSLLLKANQRIIDTDLLYVMFTSGSTGIPKGVTISHGAVVDFIENMASVFDLSDKNIIGNQAHFNFDLSIYDVFGTIKSGATMCIIPEKFFSFPIKLLNYLKEKAIDTIIWIPSALCLVADWKAVSALHVDSLRRVLFCGEVMPTKQLNAWIKEYPDVMFVNMYGPTEATEACTYYIIDREFDESDTLPIGKPFNNTDIIILDENEDPVSIDSGKKGELCVRGTSLSHGYYNDIEKTNEVFVSNPLVNQYSEIIYRTGDIVFYNKFSELEYVGRKDFQIKHKGYRIELGEIENSSRGIEGVVNSVCIYDDERDRIVLFIVGDADVSQIENVLKECLPNYMLPETITKLERIPLNDRGKADRIRLKQMI